MRTVSISSSAFLTGRLISNTCPGAQQHTAEARVPAQRSGAGGKMLNVANGLRPLLNCTCRSVLQSTQGVVEEAVCACLVVEVVIGQRHCLVCGVCIVACQAGNLAHYEALHVSASA